MQVGSEPAETATATARTLLRLTPPEAPTALYASECGDTDLPYEREPVAARILQHLLDIYLLKSSVSGSDRSNITKTQPPPLLLQIVANTAKTATLRTQ